jgi:hypothetical protein
MKYFEIRKSLSKTLHDNTTLDALQINEANVAELSCMLRARLGCIALKVELMYRMNRILSGDGL